MSARTWQVFNSTGCIICHLSHDIELDSKALLCCDASCERFPVEYISLHCIKLKNPDSAVIFLLCYVWALLLKAVKRQCLMA